MTNLRLSTITSKMKQLRIAVYSVRIAKLLMALLYLIFCIAYYVIWFAIFLPFFIIGMIISMFVIPAVVYVATGDWAYNTYSDKFCELCTDIHDFPVDNCFESKILRL
jgi:hypothetical protein